MSSDKSTPYIPLAGLAGDGYSTEDKATATCYCGAVQLEFSTNAPGLITTFACNCFDCRKITGSMFATNFTVADTHLRHVRGEDNLTAFAQAHTVGSGKTMTSSFCRTCGSLMYRVGDAFPGMKFLRTGTVDDFNLHETKLRPQVEQFTKSRVAWFHGVEGARQSEGLGYDPKL